MATLSESFDNPPRPVHEALAAGVEMLGQRQQVTFVPYLRTVLPLDGFVFWLRADTVPQSQLALNGLASAAPIQVLGSLHYATFGRQVEDETIAVRRVEFTSETEVKALAELTDNILYVGQWHAPLGDFKFTFSKRLSFYVQAGIFHYESDAIYPVFEAQLIDDASQLDDRQVVSNSLPAWLAMFQGVPFPATSMMVEPPSFPLYPSHLVAQNQVPPYAAIDIRDTRAAQAFPTLGPMMEHAQLAQERVRLSFYGLRNQDALDFHSYMLQYSELGGLFGIVNSPIMVDEKRSQVELAVIAQQKTMDVEVSYNQQLVRDAARQLVKKAFVGRIIPAIPVVGVVPPPLSLPAEAAPATRIFTGPATLDMVAQNLQIQDYTITERNGQLVVVDKYGNVTPLAPAPQPGPFPFYLSFALPGKFSDTTPSEFDGNYELLDVLVPTTITYPVNLSGSPTPGCSEPPVITVTLTLSIVSDAIPTTVGTITYLPGATSGVIVSAGFAAMAGNRIRLTAPINVDSVISGVFGTLVGLRN